MIAVDASAICAILLNEPERDQFIDKLHDEGGGLVSPVGFWEACVSVQGRRFEDGRAAVEELIHDTQLSIAEIGAAETHLAFAAWRRFGEGRHPAGLNLGDCFAYALARSRGLPLLYKGDDFSQTDVRSAL